MLGFRPRFPASPAQLCGLSWPREDADNVKCSAIVCRGQSITLGILLSTTAHIG